MRNGDEEQSDPGSRTAGPDWPAYFDAVAGMGPRETLRLALDRFEAERRTGLAAVDLGAGEGRDTIEMLQRGWTVTAVDSSEEGLRRLRAGVPHAFLARLQTVAERYESAVWPAVDFVNASFSIPHCEDGQFPGIWTKVVDSIRSGGRFAGQLFGVRDGWSRGASGAEPPSPGSVASSRWRDGRQFHTREEVEVLLGPFHVEHLDEVERPGKNAFGDPKYWHVFHIVAMKR